MSRLQLLIGSNPKMLDQFEENSLARISYIDPQEVSECTRMGQCNQFGCGAELCTAYGCGSSQEFYEVDTVCNEEFVCDTLDCVNGDNSIVEPDLKCFDESTPNGNPLILNVTEINTNGLLNNTMFKCQPDNDIVEGDPWCEHADQSINYDSDGFCAISPDVCDFGNSGQDSNAGCSNISLEQDDNSWNQYDSECVSASSPVIPSGVYDEACCYAYTINNFDIYDDAINAPNVLNGIRIY